MKSNLRSMAGEQASEIVACWTLPSPAGNHPFIAGNKRTAFVVCELFLVLNGMILTADDAECVLTMPALAAGELPEDVFAGWQRDHTILR